MATISTSNQPSPERIRVETLFSIKDLCAKAYEHYYSLASSGDTVDTYLLGASEGYASVGRYIDEALENIAAQSGLDLQLVWNEMEKQNQDMSDV